MNRVPVDPPALVRPAEDLATLAKAINAAHEAAQGAMRTGLEKAREAGDALLKAKAACKHGQWLSWLKGNTKLDRMTAWRYMQLSERWGECNSVLHLADAYRVLFSGGEEEEEQEKPSYKVSDSAPETLFSQPPPAESKFVHVSQSTGHQEWYTPRDYIEAAREVLGHIDLDPATSDIAQAIVQAEEYFTAETDGLDKPWKGRVWLNPPYSVDLVGRFVAKLCEHHAAKDVPQALLLVNNATDTKWFQDAASECRAICFPSGRIRFLDEEGNASGAPLQGQAILYFGENVGAFEKGFSGFGVIKK
jgi:phage N-6-adenine-methyltransferase